jgi:pimeloyl-ACP methyl ester carboxylesterase
VSGLKRLLVWVVALPLAAVAGLFVYAWWRERGFMGDHPPPGKFLGKAGARVHAVERLGAEPSVVFIHGNPGTGLDFLPVMEKLSPKVRTIALDRPGYGWTQRPEAWMGPTDQARLLHDAVKELGLVRPVLAGFSFGGPVSLAYALEFPDEVPALVLIAPVASPEEGHHMPEAQARLASPIGPLIAWSLGPLLAPDAVAAGYVDAFFPKPAEDDVVERGRVHFSRPTSLLASARDWHVLETELPKLAARYGELDVPVELLMAKDDRIVGPKHGDYVAAHVKNVNRVDVPQAGHQLMSTHTDQVVEAVMRALARLPARAPGP